ncbi:hypothetical protein [Aliiruegeria lutimaris]|uniref:Uncharacterized protein n=1 Tax=Aliiruegeria lutimaris TaxID=571298 RepID=A0A1G9LM43_9RHOB|nr:hypothetical protein [Aliiruegeria lutimaris]SDL63032.1 hypothetical protein SAMN04488026_10995 [Aliiruegeria lutimaris]
MSETIEPWQQPPMFDLLDERSWAEVPYTEEVEKIRAEIFGQMIAYDHPMWVSGSWNDIHNAMRIASPDNMTEEEQEGLLAHAHAV